METDALATPESTDITDLEQLKRKMHFTGTVVKTTLAGAVVDIGLEVPGVVHISQLQEEPVNRVEDVLQPGQTVDVWVRRVISNKKRIELTMIEPLGLEWREISEGMVITGKVVRLEKFGVFVDIGAERPGLVHISEVTHGYIKDASEMVKEGDEVEVKVLSMDRRKKQIRLSMKALQENPLDLVKPQPKAKQPKEKPVEEPAEVEQPVPTAMEIALREAMERSKEHKPETGVKPKRKSSSNKDESEDILTRTLEQRVRTK